MSIYYTDNSSVSKANLLTWYNIVANGFNIGLTTVVHILVKNDAASNGAGNGSGGDYLLCIYVIVPSNHCCFRRGKRRKWQRSNMSLHNSLEHHSLGYIACYFKFSINIFLLF